MADDKDKRKNRGGGQGLSANDLALWRVFTHDIEPLRDIDWAALEEQAAQAKTARKPLISETVLLPPVPTAPKPMGQDAQLDRRTEEKLRKGKITIEARIDLHGYSQERAYDALQSFIVSSQRRGLRCVLVITGKGKSGVNERDEWRFNDGILRQRVPEWLMSRPLGSLTLKYFPAQPRDGGEGAYYVYLRRTRDYSP